MRTLEVCYVLVLSRDVLLDTLQRHPVERAGWLNVAKSPDSPSAAKFCVKKDRSLCQKKAKQLYFFSEFYSGECARKTKRQENRVVWEVA